MKMDLSIYRSILSSDSCTDLSFDLAKFDNRECCFYYDESNNIRKLWLNENDFNAPVNKDFVLGGVMHFGQSSICQVDELRKKLRIQKSAKEIKFEHISKSGDFCGCLAEKKIKQFLLWLEQGDLYVHCLNINNLFWAIVDIVDSIDEPAYIPFNREIKNELYKIARSNYNAFYRALITYDYPNILPANISPLYNRVIRFIDETVDEQSFYMELLRQGLKSARNQNELIFLRENPGRTVIDSYFPFYMRPIGLFSSAMHIFDHEYQIEEQFKKHELRHENRTADNFCFDDSKNIPLIQISDCVVGLFGKYYTFINNITLDDAREFLRTISVDQKETLKLFARVMHKSENLSKLLFHSIESIEENEISVHILATALEYKPLRS